MLRFVEAPQGAQVRGRGSSPTPIDTDVSRQKGHGVQIAMQVKPFCLRFPQAGMME